MNFDLDEIAAVTYSAVFSDVCDQMGLRRQTAEPLLTPICAVGTLVGWARTFTTMPVIGPPERHYGGEIDFIDSLRADEVAVGRADLLPVAAWGELFSTAAKGRGARGAVIDGWVRDSDKIRSIPFPTFARGTRPTDSLGRVSLSVSDSTISCAGVEVSSGDLVVADADGVTIIPAEAAAEAIARAMEKASTENQARAMLLAGGKLADVWEAYRVL